MRTLCILALATLAAALCVPAAAGKERHWRVTAVETSTYGNQASWTSPCPGSFSNRLDLDVRFVVANLVYDTHARSITRGVLVKTRVRTGRWHAEGSYTPNVPDPVLGYGYVCAAAPVPATCDTTLVKRGDIALGRLLLGSRKAGKLYLQLTEVGIQDKLDPSLPDFCGGEVETGSTGGPLFPHVYSEAHNRELSAPLRKLRGRKAFTVRTKPPRLENCTIAYDACAEHGAVAFTARFEPR
jgi:hypothetical protein